jgi:tripartite-type tricarboxylate transporter receptor subunit TctC
VRKLNEALGRALAAPEFKELFSAQGIELQHSTAAELANYVHTELVRWKRALKEIGIHDAP